MSSSDRHRGPASPASSATVPAASLARTSRARAKRPIAAGARPAMKATECGSITALVSAWGVRAVRTIVWHSAWWIARPAAPTAHPPSTAPSARPSACGGSAGSAAAITAAARRAAPSVTGFAPGPYSDSTAWANAFIALAAKAGHGRRAHERRVADGERRSQEPVLLDPRSMRWKGVKLEPASVVGNGPAAQTLGGGYGLRRVDNPAAASASARGAKRITRSPSRKVKSTAGTTAA